MVAVAEHSMPHPGWCWTRTRGSSTQTMLCAGEPRVVMAVVHQSWPDFPFWSRLAEAATRVTGEVPE